MPFASQRSIEREYLLQRVGFGAFVLIVMAASLGLIGDRARIVAHTAAIYLLLLLIFRITGHRTLAETSSFDLVLLLIIGETTQQAMVGDDDTVLVKVKRLGDGNVCHTGARTCFRTLELRAES